MKKALQQGSLSSFDSDLKVRVRVLALNSEENLLVFLRYHILDICYDDVSKRGSTSGVVIDFLRYVAFLQDSADPEAMETGGNEVKVECEDRIEEDKMEVEGATSCQDAHLPKDKTKKKKRKRSESFSRQKESKPSEDAKPDAIEELVKPDTTKDDGELDASKEDVVDRNKSRKKRKRSESCETVDHKKVEKLEVSEIFNLTKEIHVNPIMPYNSLIHVSSKNCEFRILK